MHLFNTLIPGNTRRTLNSPLPENDEGKQKRQKCESDKAAPLPPTLPLLSLGRTPSGMPVCQKCQKPAGQCKHTDLATPSNFMARTWSGGVTSSDFMYSETTYSMNSELDVKRDASKQGLESSPDANTNAGSMVLPPLKHPTFQRSSSSQESQDLPQPPKLVRNRTCPATFDERPLKKAKAPRPSANRKQGSQDSNKKLHVWCDSCDGIRNCNFSICCKECRKESRFEHNIVIASWDHYKLPLRGFCTKCQWSQALVLPVCTVCSNIAAPLFNLKTAKNVNVLALSADGQQISSLPSSQSTSQSSSRPTPSQPPQPSQQQLASQSTSAKPLSNLSSRPLSNSPEDAVFPSAQPVSLDQDAVIPGTQYASLAQDVVIPGTQHVIFEQDAVKLGTQHVSFEQDAVIPGTQHVSLGQDAVIPGTQHVSLGQDAVKPGTQHVSFEQESPTISSTNTEDAPDQNISCSTCFSDVVVAVDFPGCEHVFCLVCFRNFGEMKIKERSLMNNKKSKMYTVSCPMGCASTYLDVSMLRVLGKSVYAKYRRFAALNFADDNHVLWCPFEECGHGLVPPKKTEKLKQLKCPTCQKSFCLNCMRPSHPEEDECLSKEEIETESLRLINEITKCCPNCNVRIFKDQGCNHMTCTQCKFQFCWIHLTKWEDGGACMRDHWYQNGVQTSVAYYAQNLLRSCVLM